MTAANNVHLEFVGFPKTVVVGFDSAATRSLIRECVVGRVSGARLPLMTWTDTNEGQPDFFVRVDGQTADEVQIAYAGAVTVPTYAVDKAGLHWDFSKVLTSVLFPGLIASGVVPFHAAVIAHGQGAVLLPGGSGAGKSSISLAALGARASVRATELAFIANARVVAANSTLTIDPAAVRRYGLALPDMAGGLDARYVVPLDRPDEVQITRVVFPRVASCELDVRPISARRARMLLFENAVSQLPVSQLVSHERRPLGIVPDSQQIETISEGVNALADADPIIVEGRPEAIVAHLLSH